MITLTYYFDNVTYTLAEMPNDAVDLTLRWPDTHWPKRFWATLHYDARGFSTVTTANIPRFFFNSMIIRWMQKHYQAIILSGKGKSAFRKLQAHFDARKLAETIRNT